MKVIKEIQYMLLLGILLFVVAACEDEEPVKYAPTVTTGQATGIYRKGASLHGNIQNTNGASIKKFGIMLSEFESMAEATEYKKTNSQNMQKFTLEVAGLTPQKKYFYCAYASSGASIVRGQVKSFTTPKNNVPVFGKVELSGLGAQSVVASSLIEDDGGSKILIQGFCWKLVGGDTDAPTISDNVVNVELGSERITATIDELTPEKVYLICPYGINAEGIGYGQVVRFSTLSASAPVFTDISAVDSTDMSYTVKAVIGDKGKSTITRIGFCWSAENQLPTVEDTCCELPEQLGASSFQYTIDALSYMTTYYIRAYAENEHGVSYSNVLKFTTNYSGRPVLVDITPTDSTVFGVSVESKLFGEGKYPVSRAGFCWSETNSVPTVEDEIYELASVSVGDVMKHSISNLKRQTTYYIRAFAENQEGIGYSSVYAFTTKNPGVGIYSLADLIAFRDARNAGQSTAQWKDSKGVINIYADIDASSIDNWVPIEFINYSETLDGNGFKLTGINYIEYLEDYDRWGVVKTNRGVIRNLNVTAKVDIKERQPADSPNSWKGTSVGVIAETSYGEISSCNVTLDADYPESFGGVTRSNHGRIYGCSVYGIIKNVSHVAGISVYNSGGRIEKCNNYSDIIHETTQWSLILAGGIVCIQSKGEVIDCTNEGDLVNEATASIGNVASLGGIVARQMDSSEISGCVNKGTLSGGEGIYYVGGIVGDGVSISYENEDASKVTRVITNCSNTGSLLGNVKVGNICGGLAGASSTLVGCFYGGTVNGKPGTEANAIGYDARNIGGNSDNPGIYTADDLIAFRDVKNGNGDLSPWKDSNGVINIYADIDLSEKGYWIPIQVIWSNEIINGNGHTISGIEMNLDMTEQYSYGFVKANWGTIKNLIIEGNLSIPIGEVPYGNGSPHSFGVFCGRNYDDTGVIENCTFKGSVEAKSITPTTFAPVTYVGGICGENLGMITKCKNYGSISGARVATGISGWNQGIVSDCDNYGTISYLEFNTGVSGITNNFGHFAEETYGNGSVLNCHNYGNISGKNGSAGGITCGCRGLIDGCVNEGNVYASTDVGGITAHCSDSFSVQNCSNKGNVYKDNNYTSEYASSQGGIVGYIYYNSTGTFSNNTNGGTVNGESGTDANAIGDDARNAMW